MATGKAVMIESVSDYLEFDPQDYLQEYYNSIGQENLSMLQFFAEVMNDIPNGGRMLDFGCGPTIYQLISAANTVQEIHLTDYLQSNLDEIRKWIRGDSSAFNWNGYIKAALKYEGKRTVTSEMITDRAECIRERITAIFKCDINSYFTRPNNTQYDILMSNFCIECISRKKDNWNEYFQNLISLLKPGGYLIMAITKEATFYLSGDKKFPVVFLTEKDIMQNLNQSGFNMNSIYLTHISAEKVTRAYKGFMLVSAKKEI